MVRAKLEKMSEEDDQYEKEHPDVECPDVPEMEDIPDEPWEDFRRQFEEYNKRIHEWNEHFAKSNEKTAYVVERLRIRMEEMSKFPELEYDLKMRLRHTYIDPKTGEQEYRPDDDVGEGLNVMHTKSGKEIAAFALRTIRAEIERGMEMKDRISRFSMASVNEAVVKFCLDRVYPLSGLEKGSRMYKNVEKLRERVMNEFEGGQTAQTIRRDSAWKLFNSFTYSIFNPERMRRNMDLTEIQYNGIFGNRAMGVHRVLRAVEDALS